MYGNGTHDHDQLVGHRNDGEMPGIDVRRAGDSLHGQNYRLPFWIHI